MVPAAMQQAPELNAAGNLRLRGDTSFWPQEQNEERVLPVARAAFEPGPSLPGGGPGQPPSTSGIQGSPSSCPPEQPIAAHRTMGSPLAPHLSMSWQLMPPVEPQVISRHAVAALLFAGGRHPITGGVPHPLQGLLQHGLPSTPMLSEALLLDVRRPDERLLYGAIHASHSLPGAGCLAVRAFPPCLSETVTDACARVHWAYIQRVSLAVW
jgi:hypothetical protein